MTSSKPRIITTSWDDGHPADWKIADLLSEHGIKGTFYVPRKNPERPVISEEELKDLATSFEIGGHTLNHVFLDRVTAEEGDNEIRGCQKWLSDTLGVRTKCFCYPAGRYTQANEKSAKEAQFDYARTVQLLRTDLSLGYCAPTTLQMHNHTTISYLKNALKRQHFSGVKLLLFDLWGKTDLVKMVRMFLDRIEVQGGVLHLWGHSWEIENDDGWSQLDEVLSLLANRRGFQYLTNGELSALRTL